MLLCLKSPIILASLPYVLFGSYVSGPIGDIRRFRSSEFDYGIIPIPKYESDQDKYISMVIKYNIEKLKRIICDFA